MDPHQLSSLLHPDLAQIIRTIGYLGVFAIVFAESGLFFGFFLPGDSLLFTAGFLASQGVFDIGVLAVGCFIAAVAGDQVGYVFGRRVGRPLFHREDSIFFHRKHLDRAERFYEKHGGKAIILARFMPVVRTFAPIVAGVGEMNYRRFVTFNVVGGALWGVGLTFAGYFFGSMIPDVDKYLLPIIFLIVVISVLPPALHVLRDPEQRQSLFDGLRRLLRRGKAEPEVLGREPSA
jgi:membrane-associated protein